MSSTECRAISDRIRYFIDIYKVIMAEIKPFPRPSAYEFQHALTHLYCAYKAGRELKVRQYKSAAGHLRRGVLDAWKTQLLLSDTTYNELFSIGKFSQDVVKANLSSLFKARLNEYYDIAHAIGQSSDRALSYTHYDALKKLTPQTGEASQSGIEPIAQKHKDFFEIYNHWAQYELILSSLERRKEITHLIQLMKACFSGFDIEILKQDLLLLQYDCLRMLRKPLSTDLWGIFKPWLDQRPKLKELSAGSNAVKDSPFAPEHAECLTGLLDFFGIKIKDSPA